MKTTIHIPFKDSIVCIEVEVEETRKADEAGLDERVTALEANHQDGATLARKLVEGLKESADITSHDTAGDESR